MHLVLLTDLDIENIHNASLRVLAENCPENFVNRYDLVSAEAARLEGRELEAERLYEDAIRSARENGFVQNEGVANELAARFYRARGFETIADAYLRHARACYVRWGADGKVRQLDAQYPRLQQEERTAAARDIGARAGGMDAITVVKASQAISGEILLSNLLDILMRILIENAGAQKGVCFWCATRSSRLRSGQGGGRSKCCGGPVPLASVPESVVNYVRRTRETVILDDASEDNMFSRTNTSMQTSRYRFYVCRF
jgi:GAF domain-containing protein